MTTRKVKRPTIKIPAYVVVCRACGWETQVTIGAGASQRANQLREEHERHCLRGQQRQATWAQAGLRR